MMDLLWIYCGSISDPVSERIASPEEAAGLLTSIANRGRNFTSNQSLQVMVNLPSTLPFVVDLP